MACDIIRQGQVVLAKWGAPNLKDLDNLEIAVREAHRESDRPVTLVAIVPAEAPPPADQLRKEIGARLKRVLPVCATFHQVMLGDGFVVAAKRAVFAAIMLVGSERNKVFVHSTLASVLDKCVPQARRDTIVAIRAFADRQGAASDEKQAAHL